MRKKDPIRSILRSSTDMRMSCTQWAQRLNHIKRGLDVLRQKLTLATRVCGSSEMSQKRSGLKKMQVSLLDRMSIPKKRERRGQKVTHKECSERSHLMILEMNPRVPSLLGRLTSPPPLLSRLTERPFLHIAKSKSNLTSATSNRLCTSLKWKANPRTSDVPMGCSTTGQKISRRLSGDMTFVPAGLSSRLQSLRISSWDDVSTLMQSSPITIPPSQQTNTQRNSESSNLRSHPLTLLERLNPLLTGSLHGEEPNEPTDSCSHSELTNLDGMVNSFPKCSPNINLNAISVSCNSTEKSENVLGVVTHSYSPTSLICGSPIITLLPIRHPVQHRSTHQDWRSQPSWNLMYTAY